MKRAPTPCFGISAREMSLVACSEHFRMLLILALTAEKFIVRYEYSLRFALEAGIYVVSARNVAGVSTCLRCDRD